MPVQNLATVNLCTCGHDYTSHTNPALTTGTCSECANGANSGATAHMFVPQNDVNNPGNVSQGGAGGTRNVFTKSDFKNTAIAGEPANPAVGPSTTGPARSPNNQRAG